MMMVVYTPVGEEDSWGGGGDDDDAEETAVDNISYFASIKKGPLNSMQSSACRAATLNYTGFKFPLLLLIYLAGTALYSASPLY